jgi:hypothetical protein
MKRARGPHEEPEGQEGKPPWTAQVRNVDYPGVPVPKWNSALECGILRLLHGSAREVDSTRASLQAMHGSMAHAFADFRRMVDAAPATLLGIHELKGIAEWKRIGDIEERCEMHRCHVHGLPYANPNTGQTHWRGVTRLEDLF